MKHHPIWLATKSSKESSNADNSPVHNHVAKLLIEERRREFDPAGPSLGGRATTEHQEDGEPILSHDPKVGRIGREKAGTGQEHGANGGFM